MEEATYVYYKHQKEMRSTARSARQKVVGRKPGKIMMPSDYLSTKEKKELNGAMAVYEMNKPHSYDELITWPAYYQKEYLENIIRKYRPLSPQIIGDLLHKGPNTAREYLKGLGIELRRGKNRTQEQIEGWKRFINGESEPEPEQETKPLEIELKPKAKVLNVMATVPVLSYPEKVTIHTNGKPLAVFDTIAQFYCDPNCEYEIDVTAVKKIPDILPGTEEEDLDSIPEDEF